MDLFDFFFPEQAQAAHLRKLSQSRAIGSLSREVDANQTIELESVRQDVKFLTLVVTALLKRLGETETASLGDVQDLADEIDQLDGVRDDGLDPNVLRGLMGLLKASEGDASEFDPEQFKIVSAPRYRRK